LRAARGYHASRGRRFRCARETHRRALWYARSGRRLRKRDMRALWVARVAAAARLRGISYSKFLGGLRKADVTLNRKVLANLALTDAEAFDQLVALAAGLA
jgi:large subunit ribosomal protein L20